MEAKNESSGRRSPKDTFWLIADIFFVLILCFVVLFSTLFVTNSITLNDYTVNGYIKNKKLETARNMLLYSDFTAAEISFILAFNSQSYFTEVFRKKYGLTPSDFRAQNLFSNELDNLGIRSKKK